MTASDVEQSTITKIAYVVSDATGIPVDGLDNIVIVYEQKDGSTGMLTLACCNTHAVRILAAGTAVLADVPLPAQPFDCTV